LIITISGPPGSGKSTLSKILSVKLGLELVAMGDIFRKCANERCMSLEEFGMIAQCNEKIDREIDDMQKNIAAEKDNIIIEGRLSGFLVDADIRIWLKAPLEIRARRISKRENKPEALAREETYQREECERERYLKYYDIDIKDLSVYDLIIDSSKWNPEELSEIVQKAVKS
jgi:cytidylate kinase